MTLADLRSQTSHMPEGTVILVQAPWGELMPAAIVTIEDLLPDDPTRHEFPPNSIALAPTAEPLSSPEH